MLNEGFSGSSAGKESACNAGDSGSIPGSGKYPGEGTGYLHQHSWTSWWLSSKESTCNVGKIWVQSLRRSPREGHSNPLQFSCLQKYKSPWTEESSKLQSMGLQRVGHGWATKHSTAHELNVLDLWKCIKIFYIFEKKIIKADKYSNGTESSAWKWTHTLQSRSTNTWQRSWEYSMENRKFIQ